MNRLIAAAVMLSVVGTSFVKLAFSQSAVPPAASKPAAGAAAYPQSNAAMDAEREKIWDSPQMLRARAWVKEYCAHSAKITPEQAKEYEAELANLTPKQMQLWLLKFQHEEEMIQEQQQAFNRARHADVSQAMALHKQMQQSYSNVNRDTNEAAQTAESSYKQQQEFSQQDALQKSADRDAAATDLMSPFHWGGGYGPYGGYGYGGVHYHFH